MREGADSFGVDAADLMWVAAPEIALAVGRSATAPRPSRTRMILRQTLAIYRRDYIWAKRVGPALLLAATDNQRRTLLPVLAAANGRATESNLSRPNLSGYARRSISGFRTASRLDLPGGFVQEFLLTAARAVSRATRTIQRDPPRVTVVANQHSIALRAWVLASRRANVPTVYLPHVAAADNAQYRDLPTDYAGLRGKAEVELYNSFGADLDRLSVVGDPSFPVDVRAPASLPALSRGTVLLAVSPHAEQRLRRMISLVETWPSPVVVAPHPRSDTAQLEQLIPRAWSLAPIGSTMRLLRSGPGCLLQDSSGVSWESLALGIPTIQVASSQDVPSYPLLRSELVPRIIDRNEAVRVISEAIASGQQQEHRLRLRNLALDWCSHTSTEASTRAWDLIQLAAKKGTCAEPVLDGWGHAFNLVRRLLDAEQAR